MKTERELIKMATAIYSLMQEENYTPLDMYATIGVLNQNISMMISIREQQLENKKQGITI